jgi:hypothetical protein
VQYLVEDIKRSSEEDIVNTAGIQGAPTVTSSRRTAPDKGVIKTNCDASFV